MAILAPIANFGILLQIIAEDPLVTADNLANNKLNFIFAIICFALVAVLDIIVATSLYKFFKDEQNKLNLYTMVTRVVYGVIFLIASLFLVLTLTSTEVTMYHKILIIFRLYGMQH